MRKRKGETGAGFGVSPVGDGMVCIHGLGGPALVGHAVDTAEAWRVFRDEVKAGKWDHVGEFEAVAS